MLSKRLAKAVRVLRLFTFSVAKLFMTSQQVALREGMYAVERIQEGEHDEAIAILQQAIDSNPNNTILYHLYKLRGLAHFVQWKPYEAIEDFNRAIALDSFDSEPYVIRGSVRVILHEYERAVEDFTAAIEVNPDAEAYSGRGDAHVGMGKYNAALKDYEKVMDLQPDAHAYAGRGKAYFGLMRYDKAMNDFDKAVLLDPSNIAAYMMRGNIQKERKNYERAIEEYARVIALSPEVVDWSEQKFLGMDTRPPLYESAVLDIGNAYCGRGISRSRIGDTDGALRDFGAAIRLMPENANFYLARATAYIEQDEYAEAMQDVKVALELDSRSAVPHLVRSSFHYRKEDYDKALQGCHETVAISPNWAEPYRLRGIVLMYLGDYEAALHDFGKSLELESGPSITGNENFGGMTMMIGLGYPTAYAFRGFAHLLLGDEVMGREDILTATELGYAQSDLEEEIENLVADGNTRKAIKEVIRSVVERAGDESRVYSPGKSKTLSREGYVSLFRRLGFHDIKVGRTLKHREPIPSIYFNCRYGIVSFVTYAKDGHRFCLDFWDRIPPKKKSDAKDNLITVVPRSGKEQEAFEYLLGDNTADRSPEVKRQSQESTMRIMANDYRGRNPRDTVDSRPISAVIHVATCGHIPHNPSHWWITFDSLEAAQSEFGIDAATCVVCLEGQGTHLDRVQRA